MSLVSSSKEITLKEIVGILENNAFEKICKTENLTLQLFWEEKQKALLEVLDTPLSELQTYQEKADKNFNYMI